MLLYCLRSSPEAKTFFAGVRRIVRRLDQQTREILFKPVFRTGIDYIFGNLKTEPGNGPVIPVLYGCHDDPFIRYDQELMVGVTTEAVMALSALKSALQTVKQSICLRSGDLLIMDNRRVVHGRSPFKPLFDGNDRWLQRVKILRDFDQVTANCDLDLDRRIVRTAFAQG